MNLPLFIAGRYLFARKSHNVINIISAISAVGMAIGTAALVIILSVYNGFDSLVKASLSDIDPDILITPSTGKVFVAEGEAFDWAYENPLVFNMSSILQENVFVSYEGRQSVAKAKGVDEVYEQESPVGSHIISGTFSLHRGQFIQCAVGAGLAYKMGINPNFIASLEIYFPARDREVSLINPAASLEVEYAHPSGVFSVNSDSDNSLVILPIESMRSLLGYEKEVSAIEIRLVDGCTKAQTQSVIRGLQERLPEGLEVRDRFQQNESLYKMMKYEKAAIFLILIFIIIIIAFNVFGSLSMLLIEKEEDISTFRSMGATDKVIKRIFILEGWLISLLGLAAGLVLGVVFAFIQQKFGIIPMPGNYIVSAYPVIVKVSDLLLTAAGVAVIGYLVALLPVASWYKEES